MTFIIVSHLKALLYKEYLTNKKSIFSVLFVQFLIPITLAYLLLVYVPDKFEESRDRFRPKAPKDNNSTFNEIDIVRLITSSSCNRDGNIYVYPENNVTKTLMEFVKLNCSLILIGLNTKEEFDMKVMEITSNEKRNDSDIAAILFNNVKNAPEYQLDYVVRPVSFRDSNSLYKKQKQPQLYDMYQNAYYLSSFVEIQMAVNIAFLQTNNLIPAFLINLLSTPLPDVDIFYDAPFMSAVIIYYSAFIGTVLPLMVFMKRVLDEKSSEIKKLLKLMAMREFEYWLSKSIVAVFIFILMDLIIVYFVYRVVGDRIDPSLLFVVLLIYFFSQLFLTMALSAFFKHSIFGIAAILAVQLLSSYPLWWFLRKPGVQEQVQSLFQGRSDLPEELYLLFCVIIPPNYSLLLSLLMIVENSNYAYALKHLPHLAPYTPHWPNIFNTPPEYKIMSLALIMCAAIMGAIMWLGFHVLLCLYIRSEDDITTEVNLWTKNEEAAPGKSEQMESMFEEEPTHLSAGIVIKNVTKTFSGDRVAVNNLSLNLYFGQITVLLGHNGAGKTTLMNMMTGLTPPTSGSIVIDGFDVTIDREKSRRRLGLCPQREMLLENFTVEEHMYIFAILKGFPESKLKDEITNVLKLLNLSEKRKFKAKSLSGGMRRKLQFGIAIVGGCKILVLDEPSSGLDVESRRLIWDLLRSLRKGFLILMTTHHMEEAECLGDRIIIMADGQVKCSGSSSFLKQVFNVGHHLRILTDSEDKKEIEHFVYENCSGVKLENQTALELVFRIPPLKSNKLHSLCTLLENNKDSLRIQSFGLNMTSLDDVFLSSYEMFKVKKEKPVTESTRSYAFQKARKTSNCTMIVALFLKRFQADKKRWPTFVTFLMLNILFTLFGFAMFYYFTENSSDKTEEWMRSLNFTEFGYTDLVGFCSIPNTTLCDSFTETAKNFGVNLIPNNMTVAEQTAKLIKNDYDDYREKVALAIDSRPTGAIQLPGIPKDYTELIQLWYSKQAKHSLPISINIAFNTLLKQSSNNPTSSIKTSVHTIPVERSDKARQRLFTLQRNVYIIPFALVYGMLFAACFSASLLTSERTTKVKLLQYMAGVTPLAYWGANLIYDCVYLFLVFTPFWVIVFALPRNLLFSSSIVGGLYMLLIFTNFITFDSLAAIAISYFGFILSSASINYLASLVFSKPSTAFVTLLLFNAVPATIFNEFFLYRKRFKSTESDTTTFADVMAKMFEWAALMSNFWLFVEVVSNGLKVTNTIHLCSALSTGERAYSCRIELVRDCCRSCQDCYNENYNPFRYEEPGDLFKLIWIYVLFLGAAILSLALEFRILERELFSESWAEVELDCDVKGESDKVDRIVSKKSDKNPLKSDKHLFLCHKLTKTFKGIIACKDISFSILTNPRKVISQFVAVNRLSFSVQKNEFFGFLGVNGAGKTTTFRMMTGDLAATSGNAYLSSYSLRDNFREYQQEIGYCPQQNVLLESLTGRQTLEFFARVRGISSNNLTKAVNEMLQCVDLEAYSEFPSSVYSGGNMRKLALGIALIGSPIILMLDEPSSGVDPVARRKMWKAIDYYKKTNNGSVILSSHSLDECEALCNRIAILARGTLQCIGSIQHLKSRFCRGFIVHIKLNMKDNKREEIDASIKENFSDATVIDEHIPLIVYQINDSNVSISTIFKVMENIKQRFDFEEYNVSQTTLEQLFLQFSTQTAKQ